MLPAASIETEDRDGWVRTHDLEVGERLRSEQGPLEIATIRRMEGARQVFNLEVASDHTYLVSDSAILSHNMCDNEELLDSLPKNKRSAYKSLKKQAEEHQEKLRAYKADPEAHDNKNFLRDAPTPEIRQKIIESRIRSLNHQIDNFEKQAADILEEAK